MNASLLSESGAAVREIELPDAIFGARVNVPLMHQVVVAQLAAARSGTHSTKTRGEVRGGGKKPWRQKGTGRARHGSTREPQWVGGGVVFGPKPHSHRLSMPKKMKAAALRSALSDRAAQGRLVVAEDLALEAPKSKRAHEALRAWGVDGKSLVVLKGEDDHNAAYSFRNLPSVHVIAEHQLNVYDVLNADWVVFLAAALDAFIARTTGSRSEPAPETSSTEEEAFAEIEEASR
jgi:large subunit ribosomal protein L4